MALWKKISAVPLKVVTWAAANSWPPTLKAPKLVLNATVVRFWMGRPDESLTSTTNSTVEVSSADNVPAADETLSVPVKTNVWLFV